MPEATIQVKKVVKNHLYGQLEFRLGQVIEVKHWDRVREKPTR